jgi:hydrogenase maturation protease
MNAHAIESPVRALKTRPQKTNNHSLLVIGYGNTLRGDDGVGPRVAEAVAAMQLPNVRVITCHQLTPELSDPVAGAREVVFVDAALDAHEHAELREIKGYQNGEMLLHGTDPRMVLGLAKQVFGRAPKAWVLAIPVKNMELGDGLSTVAQKGFEEAVKLVRRFCGLV